jgi:hypothetical protein
MNPLRIRKSCYNLRFKKSVRQKNYGSLCVRERIARTNLLFWISQRQSAYFPAPKFFSTSSA